MTAPEGRAVLLWTTDGLEIATVSGVSRAIDGTYAVLDDTGRRVAALSQGENNVRIYDFGGGGEFHRLVRSASSRPRRSASV